MKIDANGDRQTRPITGRGEVGRVVADEGLASFHHCLGLRLKQRPGGVISSGGDLRATLVAGPPGNSGEGSWETPESLIQD